MPTKLRKPIRVALSGRHLDDLRRFIRDLPLLEVEETPDLVISYGGDGSLLGAERDYPGIPKFPLRDYRKNPKCPQHGETEALRRLCAGELTKTAVSKISASVNNGPLLYGINDILISKSNIASAVRYRLWINDELLKGQIVGDGLVVSTAFGSSGYFRNITHCLFRVGIGLAFNNCSEPVDHIVVENHAEVRAEVIRGPAVLLADNDPRRLELAEGDIITFRELPQQVAILGLDIFRCRDCLRLRENGV